MTVDDIVSAAEVSHRTFYRYFPSKEDVLLGLDQERIDHFADVLRSRPTDEPILTSIRQSMIEASDAVRPVPGDEAAPDPDHPEHAQPPSPLPSSVMPPGRPRPFRSSPSGWRSTLTPTSVRA